MIRRRGGFLFKRAPHRGNQHDQEHADAGDEPCGEDGGGDDPALGGGERAKGVRAVELPDGDEVEEIDDRADLRDRGEHRRTQRARKREGRDRRAEAPDRPGEADEGFLAGRGQVLAQTDERAETGNEHGRGAADAESPQHGDVPHFVDVNREHQAPRELPAPERPIDAEGDEHREQRAHLRQPEQEQLALGEHEEGDDAQPAENPAPVRLGRMTRCGLRRLSGHRTVFRDADQRVHFRLDELPLPRAGREQRMGAAPGGERRGWLHGASGLIGEAFQLRRVDERAAAGATEEKRSQLCAALRARAERPGGVGRHGLRHRREACRVRAGAGR